MSKLIDGMSPLEFDKVIAGKYVMKVANAAKRGIGFNLTLSQYRKLFTRKYCAYTGVYLTMQSVGGEPLPSNYATLERIDNMIGYVPGNVIVISHEANKVKAVFEHPDTAIDMPTAIRMFSNIDKLQKAQKKNKIIA